MKKVKMVRSTQGSPNGVNVITYHAGGIYEFTNEELANTFIKIGAAEEVEEASERKDAGGAPSNKSAGAPLADSARRRKT